ncbi:serine/threonine-protein kinase [Arenibaculum pallidiluteum]|uniref:serine/threonine-protein kinase n=1 Tax=Arenibaculum pallidiluteum TaxID=2812559 RepID=UPI001A97C4DA|nr:serine/threonine-protein kinase [Arenibaculum pallidiluteum]
MELPCEIGRYRLLERIGSGAMGAVFRGEDPVIGRTVAVKAIRTDLVDPADRAFHFERFQVEARSAGRCLHPNIVAIYDCVEQDGAPYIVMEFAAGTTLQRVLDQQRRLPVPASVAILQQLLAALDHAHGRGVIHRDIKPANLILGPDGHLKVTDFGISRLGGGNATMNGLVLGTPAFMAPEQAKGRDLDGRADLFAAGMVLLHLVTGRSPYKGSALAEIVLELASDEAFDLRAVETVDPQLVPVIERALAKDPDARFDSAAGFARQLSDAMERSRGAGLWPAAGPGTSLPDLAAAAGAAVPPASASGGLDQRFLQRVERELTQVVGPIARILVREVAKHAATEQQLLAGLASRLPEERNRTQFLKPFARTEGGGGRSGAMLPAAGPPRLAIPPEILEAAQVLLASFVGPLARIIVTQSCAQATSTQQFYRDLAGHITREKDRDEFRRRFARDIAPRIG